MSLVFAQEGQLPDTVSLHEENLKIANTNKVIKDVYFLSKNKWLNLTKFPRPNHIFDYKVSPNGVYAYVWHQDFSPRKLSIFNLKDGILLKSFSPGYGGFLNWTKGNTILHHWGCGTNCVMIAIYNSRGEEIWSENATGMSVLPEKEYIAIFPTLTADPTPLTVYSLDNLKVICSVAREELQPIYKLEWENNDNILIEFWAPVMGEKTKTLNIQSECTK